MFRVTAKVMAGCAAVLLGFALASAPVLAAESAKPNKLASSLAARGFERGTPALIRIFKQESQIELWLGKSGHFELFATYPICFWDGRLGPKLFEGDRQAPEGFYAIAEGQLRWYGRWLRGLDIDYPNAFDRAHGRTGSAIYIHGGCTSIGCFAITNPVIEDVFELVVNALDAGQRRIAVHVFPFRMTAERMAASAASPWISFWRELKAGYDEFEASRVPPRLAVCEARYVVRAGLPGYDGSDLLQENCATPLPREDRQLVWPAMPPPKSDPAAGRLMAKLVDIRKHPPRIAINLRNSSASGVAKAAANELASNGIDVACNPGLPSCRRWIMLAQKKVAAKRTAVTSGKRTKKASN